MISSPLSGERGETTAVVAALVSTGACLSRGKPKTNAAPHAAVSEKREGYSAYRYGGHGTQPLAKSLALQCPKIMVRRSVPVIKSAHPDPCCLRSNSETVW